MIDPALPTKLNLDADLARCSRPIFHDPGRDFFQITEFRRTWEYTCICRYNYRSYQARQYSMRLQYSDPGPGALL